MKVLIQTDKTSFLYKHSKKQWDVKDRTNNKGKYNKMELC